jgi:hypothetical protein
MRITVFYTGNYFEKKPLSGRKVARNSYMQMHGEIHTLRNQKLACHIHVSTVILPFLPPWCYMSKETA